MPAPRLDANSWHTQIFIEVEQDGYSKSAAAFKAELKRLEEELQRADARGDRKQGLNILSLMLDLQRRFMERWQGLRSPARSGSSPDSV
jgi:hypothetical protein